MKRLKPGEYIAMTDEQKKQHRAERYKEWLKKPGVKKKVSEYNKKYQHSLTLAITQKPCRKCGKMVWLRGRCSLCYDCKHPVTKTSIQNEQRLARSVERNSMANKILFLATTTTMLQREIAESLGTYQEYVSQVLRKNGLRRGAYTKRKDKENERN